MIEQRIKEQIRDIPDFPAPGIIFKDITPVLANPALCKEIADELITRLKDIHIDAIAAIESRGFLFGMLIAERLNIPFIPVRKKGKLPFQTIAETYRLEYGEATIEMHQDAFKLGSKILIHDDILATGGTVEAASKLVERLGGKVTAYSFLLSLSFLNGEERIRKFSGNISTLANY